MLIPLCSGLKVKATVEIAACFSFPSGLLKFAREPSLSTFPFYYYIRKKPKPELDLDANSSVVAG